MRSHTVTSEPPGEKARMLRELRQHNPELLESVSLKLIEDLAEAHSAIATTKEKLAAIHEKVNDMMAPPHFPARCISVTMSARGVEALVVHNGQARRVLIDTEEIDPDEVSCGTEVLLNETLNRVVGVSGEDVSWGETAVVDRWIEDRLVVTVRGIKNGDRVALDSHGVMALSVLPSSSGEEYMIQRTPDVSFSDIGGLDHVIGRVKELVHLHCHGNGAAQRYGLPRTLKLP